MRVAVVHEWLVTRAGSEKVVEQILQIWPQADLFALVDFYGEKDRAWIDGRRATTTFLQRWPFAEKKFRAFLPFMPLAIEQLDLSGYDLVVSSAHAVAKGVLTGPDQTHISYVHSPIRYAWDLQHQYLRESGLRWGVRGTLARAILHYMRIWDARTANGVDAFAANSAYIGRRIAKAYGRRAEIIPPPVDVAGFPLCERKEAYYVAVSRMVPYKRMPLIVEAFSTMPKRRLVVIGDGPELERCKAVAAGNVELLGYQEGDALRAYVQQAKAIVFAAEEDFGITLVEAQACGTPVIAFGRGGALETVIDSADPAVRTGLFFHEQSVAAIRDAVERFEAGGAFDPRACRRNAERFAPERFRTDFAEFAARVRREGRL